MKPRFRTLFWGAAAAVVVVLIALAFRPQPVAVDVAETWSGPMLVTVRDEGRTRVRNEYVVSAPVAGKLQRVALKPGAHVHAGDVVARIEPSAPAFVDARTQAELRAAADAAAAALSVARAELERAEAEARFARTDLERVRNLRSEDLAAPDALDRAELRARVAETALARAQDTLELREAELEAARARLIQPGDTDEAAAVVEVRAPISGRVLRVAHESAGVIAAGSEILTLGDPADLEVVVEMLSTDAVQVEPGDDVILEDFGGGEPLRGRVRLVEPYGFTKISALGVEEQRVNVIVDLVSPPSEWAMLGHGYRVEAAVVVWSEEGVVQAPVGALFRSREEWAVFRVDGDVARLTPVAVGRDNGRTVQILSGIEAGERVVLYPGELIADGVRVRPRE
ncbi:MAG TPA: HlyD family efflux transporter periplasmic adaptor subunit [Gammaproteobacteria bacterium]